MNNSLEQYTGKLSNSEIVAGMNAAAQNAKRLYNDANLLLNNSSYPSALSLAILSIEETGKISILRSIALETNQKERVRYWRDYRSHKEKNRLWLFLDLFIKGARKADDFHELFEENAEHTVLIDNIKQLGFYTDCLGKKNWSIPDTVIDKELAEGIVNIAGLLTQKREYTEREIELYIHYLKPVWKKSKESMEAAIVAWHKHICAEGLSDRDPDRMEKFILEGIGIDIET